MALALMGLGYIVMAVGGIWLLVVAFQESVLWGLGCLLVPFVSLIFVIMNFDDAKKPFFIWLGGLVLVIIGVVIAPKDIEGFQPSVMMFLQGLAQAA